MEGRNVPKFPLTIKVTGLEEAKRKLDRLSANVLIETHKSLGEWAREISEESKRLVPVRTGRLKASIHYFALTWLRWVVMYPLRYAGFVEYGTWKMTPRPYVRQAIWKTRERFLWYILERLLKGV